MIFRKLIDWKSQRKPRRKAVRTLTMREGKITLQLGKMVARPTEDSHTRSVC